MKKTLLWVIGIVVVVLIVVSVAGKKQTENQTIKIGFVGPLTGDTSSLGQASKSAVEIAVNEINASGGINGRPIEMIYEDGKCLTAAALSAGQKLISFDKVTAIIGGLCSGETSAFIKQASEAKVPVISYCSSAPSLSQSGQYFTRTYPSDSYQGKFAAEYVFNTLKAKSVAIVYQLNDWSQSISNVFKNRFEELGGKVALSEGVSQDVHDYKTILAKIKDQKIQDIYLPMYVDSSMIVINEANDLSLNARFVGPDAWKDPKFISGVNKKSDVTYVGSTGNAEKDFQDKYLTKTKQERVPICAPQAYDAVKVLSLALKQVGTDTVKLSTAIRSQDFQGVTGRVSFDSNGDISTVSFVVNKIVNGKLIDIQ